MPDTFMTIDEAADFLKVAKTTLYRWVHLKSIPYRKHGRRVIFTRVDLEKWSNQQVMAYMPEG